MGMVVYGHGLYPEYLGANASLRVVLAEAVHNTLVAPVEAVVAINLVF